MKPYHYFGVPLPLLLLTQYAQAQSVDPWTSFDSSQKVCTPVQRALSKLPFTHQSSVLQFCFNFVGTIFQTVTGETPVYITKDLPLKTVTVSSTPAAGRFRPRQERHYDSRISTPTPVSASTVSAEASPLVTAPPRAHEELKRLPPTPAIFQGAASKVIRTGCACLGISTKVTLPIYTTTTTTLTVPASCVLSPYSAIHLSSYGPASVATATYPYEIWPWEDDYTAFCCRWCMYTPGCVQFEILDEYPYCVISLFNVYYENSDPANTLPGIPAAAADRQTCPRGYLAVEGVVPDSVSTTATRATYLGPCAVSTVAG